MYIYIIPFSEKIPFFQQFMKMSSHRQCSSTRSSSSTTAPSNDLTNSRKRRSTDNINDANKRNRTHRAAVKSFTQPVANEMDVLLGHEVGYSTELHINVHVHVQVILMFIFVSILFI